LLEWYKAEGDQVAVDDPLFELETDKITMKIVAEAAGRLSIAVNPGATVQIGQVVGAIESQGEQRTPAAPAAMGAAPASAIAVGAAPAAAAARVAATAEPPRPSGLPASSLDHASKSPPLSPAVRRLVVEHELDPLAIPGRGKGGRITSGDIADALDAQSASDPSRQAPETSASAPAKRALPPAVSVSAVPAAASPRIADNTRRQQAAASPPVRSETEIDRRETRKPMSSLRRRIAERLVAAQQTSAMLTTFNEADMSGVLALRERFQESFEKQHGIRLGFISIFVKAVIDALQTVPEINARIEGEEIVQNHYFDIGVAVATKRGLIVPVLRNADRLTFSAIELAIADLATRAQNGAIELHELTGGCFTISNGGVYGSLLSTPILNPPQSAILGMHAIKKRPVAVQDQIVIRPMMYLALSYDHRLIDGREAVTFLKRIVECIEEPERILLKI
jgi:2-oxoglutarate dehydrogenase E2 component (dihydrolipoamide succinyltransferase)